MKKRWCQDVIEEMLKEIPKEEKAFINDLNWNKRDSVFKAPEEIVQWARTQETLMYYIPYPPEKEWQWKVLSIFTTKSIKELKEIKK